MNPLNNQKQLLTFSASSSASSTSSSSTTSSSSSSPTGGCTINNNNNLSENQTLNSSNKKRNKALKKSKKYEKLLTVKSQDSAVTTTTTATTIDNSNSTSSYLSQASILTRLLTNKVTLQPFIDQFIETIFTNTANLPPVVQHLFEFFDLEVKKYQNQINIKDTSKNASAINEELNKLTRIWKTNSYFLRYWINLIKNPDCLLSIDPQTNPSLITTNPATNSPSQPSPPHSNKNLLVDSSLTCIAQTLLDACSNTETFNLYDTQSPINRLLFIREVPRYKEMIENFYKEMQTYTPITDHELHYYLNEFSKCQQQQQATQHLGATLNNSGSTSVTGAALNEINSIQVLLQLYEYYEKYEKQINTLLGQQQCSILLPVHHRLVQIKDLMMSQTCNQSFANHQQTINRINLQHTLQPHQNQNQQQHACASNQYNPYNHQYQQPINCYAAAADLNLMNQIHTLSSNLSSNHQHQPFTTQKFF